MVLQWKFILVLFLESGIWPRSFENKNNIFFWNLNRNWTYICQDEKT